jgi:hypothetical protein
MGCKRNVSPLLLIQRQHYVSLAALLTYGIFGGTDNFDGPVLLVDLNGSCVFFNIVDDGPCSRSIVKRLIVLQGEIPSYVDPPPEGAVLIRVAIVEALPYFGCPRIEVVAP